MLNLSPASSCCLISDLPDGSPIISCTTTDQMQSAYFLPPAVSSSEHKCHEMTYMQTVRRRVKANIKCCLSIVNQFSDSLLHQSPARSVRAPEVLHKYPFLIFPFFFKTYILVTANLLPRRRRRYSCLELFEVFWTVSFLKIFPIALPLQGVASYFLVSEYLRYQ